MRSDGFPVSIWAVLFCLVLIQPAMAQQPLLVVPSTASNQIILYDGLTGALISSIPEPGRFSQAVKLGPDGLLYVSGGGASDVIRYDLTTGASVGVFVPSGSGGLAAADDMEFLPDGSLLVASFFSRQVLRYNGTTGAFIDAFVAEGSGGVDRPWGLELRDGMLYVSSFATDQILRYDATTGEFVDEFVTAGSGGLDGPSYFIFGPDGNLYVSGVLSDAIFRYDGATGEFLDVFVPANSGGLDNPQGLAFGPDGDLIVSSAVSDQILRFDGQTGGFVSVFVPAGLGGLDAPNGLILINAMLPEPPDKLLVWTDLATDNLSRANVDGSNVGLMRGGLSDPSGVATTSDGQVFWTEWFGSNNVSRIQLNAQGKTTIVPNNPEANVIAVDSAGGKIYWTDWGQETVMRANLDGSDIEVLAGGPGFEAEGIDLDLENGHLYWANALGIGIMRDNLDGGDPQTIVDTAGDVRDLRVDPVNDRLYWGEVDTRKIRRSNLDGTGIEDLYMGGQPWGIALDLPANTMYWVERFPGKLMKSDLDGNNPEEVIALDDPVYLRLFPPLGLASNLSEFAQFGNGSGLTSEIVLTNPSSVVRATGQVNLFNADGSALDLQANLTGTEGTDVAKVMPTFNIAPLGSARVSTDGLGDLSQGSVEVRSSTPIGGVIRFEIGAIGVAGVGAAPPVTSAVAPAKREVGGINTGLAIRNVSQSETAMVTLTLRDLQGTPVANGTIQLKLAADEELDLNPNARIAQFIDELFPQAQTDDIQGTVTLESSIPVAVIALELGQAGQFTTLPVTPPPDPVVVPNAAFQVRADMGVTLDGTNVTTWGDQSGNGRDATQAEAANQPVFVDSHPGIGGGPVIRFEGQKWLDYDGGFFANTAYTVLVVEGRNPPDSNVVANFFMAGLDAAAAANLVLGYENDTTLRFSDFGVNLDAAVLPFATQEFHVTTFRFDPNTGRRTYRDGVLVASDARTVPLASYNGASIGHFPAIPNFSYFGDIAEIVVYTSALSDSQRQSVESRLAAAYGLSLAGLQLAQFGNGSGLKSEILLTNANPDQAATGRVGFFNADGSLLDLQGNLSGTAGVDVNQTMPTFDIAPLGSVRIATDGEGDLSQGSVAVESGSLGLGGVIRFEIDGIGVAGVGAAPALTRAVSPAKREAGGINTGLAIRNASPNTTALVTLRLLDLQGNQVPNGTTVIELAPNAREAKFINELFEMAQTDNFQGTIAIDSTSPVAVIALELGQAGQFTTLPVTARP